LPNKTTKKIKACVKNKKEKEKLSNTIEEYHPKIA